MFTFTLLITTTKTNKMKTIEIQTEKLTNETIFDVTAECTRLNINTKDVDEVLVWVGLKLHILEFCWRNGELVSLQKKW